VTRGGTGLVARGIGLVIARLSGYSLKGLLPAEEAVTAERGIRHWSFGGGVGGIVVPVEYRDRDEMVGATGYPEG
jgi:hypothetical protein